MQSNHPRGTPYSLRGALPFACCLIAAALLTACASQPTPPRTAPPPEFARPPAEVGPFADIESGILLQHDEDTSGFILLDSNEAGLLWRLALIDSARSSIDLQYYLWYGDTAGRLIMKHLLDAADRGVHIRLLVDDLNTLLQDASTVVLRDEVAAWVDAHPNIELRLFNPWNHRGLAGRLGEAVGEFKRINQRMHNKALIIDNRATIVGGRNIGDEYLGLNRSFNFHDLDVLGVGPIARQTSDIFDRYWNSRWVAPVDALTASVSPEILAEGRVTLTTLLEDEPAAAGLIETRSWARELASLPEELLPGTSAVYADLPTETGFDQLMLEHIREMLEKPATELMIVNAYIIPADRSIETLRALNQRGVEVRILTNSLASHDVPAVNSHYRRWRKPILETGALLYEMRDDAAMRTEIADMAPVSSGFMGLHSKAMMVDRRLVYIGSMNFDPRSASLNTEMGAFIDSPALGTELAALIERDIDPANSWEVTLDTDGRLRWTCDTATVTRQPARNFWQRVQDVFFRLFPKEYY